jgi:hypothetical protein
MKVSGTAGCRPPLARVLLVRPQQPALQDSGNEWTLLEPRRCGRLGSKHEPHQIVRPRSRRVRRAERRWRVEGSERGSGCGCGRELTFVDYRRRGSAIGSARP